MARIAIGGFQHETNTFAPSKADYAAFEAGGGWPGVQHGEAIFDAVGGANIPAAGAIQALRASGHSLVGTAWAAASPSAHVSRDAFERIVGEIVARLQAAGPVDGVYHPASRRARLQRQDAPFHLRAIAGRVHPQVDLAPGFRRDHVRP